MADTEQAKLLKQAREALGITTEELGKRLKSPDFPEGRSLATVRAWLLPKGAKAYRTMPESVHIQLGKMLSDKRRKGKAE